MTNSLIPKPFDIRDAKRAREEAARLAERRDGAAWSGTGEVAKAVEAEAAAREELAGLTEAEQQAIREQVVAEALERAEAFIDVNRTLDALDVKYDGVITNAGQIGAKLTKAEADLLAHNSRLTANDTAITTLTGTTLPALQNSLDVAKAELAPLPGKIADNATKLATAQGQLSTLKDATIPALAADLVAAKGRLASAEVTLLPLPEKLAAAQADLTTAFGQLSTVDARVDAAKTAAATDASAKANQAKVDATAAAALVAQAKADTAKAEALTAAATDAKTKADAAQAAAVAAAKTATDLAAAGAKSEAIAAATLDAKAKADAAQAAAVTAAASAADSKVATAKAATLTEAATAAQVKADAALTAAKTDATAKAAQALTDAKADAKLKADAAQAAAITAAKADAKLQSEAAEARAAATAALDAKAKADAAQAASLAAAKTYADAQASGASGDALAAAKADATAKANAAQAAAISAAALDATAKKEQAEANAALDAKTKADKALADAKLDATSKADAAREAAKAAAALDATSKADAAKLVATNAQAAANKAQADALSAAGLAGSKGKVWFQPEAPRAGTAYSWAGVPDKSESIRSFDGAENDRNICIFPDPGANTWSSRASTGITLKRTFSPTGGPIEGSGYQRVEITAASASWWRHTSNALPVLEPAVLGDAYTVLIYARTNTPTESFSLFSRWSSATGANVGAEFSERKMLTTEWAPYFLRPKAVSNNVGAVRMAIDLGGLNAAMAGIGASVDIAMVAIYKGDRTEPLYFDGNTPDDREFDLWVDTDDGNRPYRWDHAAKAWKEATDQQIVAAAKAAATADAKAAQAQTDATQAIGDAATAKSVADKATTDILAIPAKIETAKQAAIDAAALVAEAKATAAQSAATTAAAADAKTKADAAQAAAIAAAKTATDLAASGAQQGAIDAAKADATTKANAAQMAAVNAAALDATAKANQAKTDAITAAANDSTTKANNAKADAVTAAATDATAKANQAKTDAVASATTMTNGIGKNLSSTAVPTVTNAAPQGSVWRRTDASGRVIGVWEQTAAGVGSTWTPRLIASEVMDNLDVGKLSASGATINSLVVAKMAAQVATVIELNADRIITGQVTATQIDTTSLAVAISSIIKLNAGAITAGTIDTARLNVTTLAASIANIIQLNASAITAGTVDTARLNVTTLAANLATVLQLNADRITAGTINTARLNVVAIAAATAAFQQVDIKNLFASTGTLDEAVITKLWADVVNSKKITTEMLAVGSFDNLFDEPDFTNKGASWTITAPHNIGAFGRSGAPALRIVGQTGIFSIYNKPLRRPIAPESAYRGKVWVRASAAVPAAAFRILAAVYTETGAASFPMASAPALVAGEWTLVSGVIKTTNTAATASFGLTLRENFPAGVTLDVDFASLTRMNAGELTVDGTVTAHALESELVLATKIVAGDPNSTHAEMSPLGFKVFASPAGGGAPTEVVRLGVAATDDYFAVTKANGDLAASISQNGVMSGVELNATDALWYKGDELQTILDRMPRGIVSAGYRATSSAVNATYGNIIPYLRIEATLYPGRIYKVWTSGIKLGLDAGTRVTVGVKYTNTGFASISSNGLTETATDTDLSAPVVQELFAVGTEQTVSFLLYLQVLNSGQAGFRGTASVPTRLVVEDAGPFTSQIGNGVHMNGVATGTPPAPPAAVNTYRKQYGSIGSMNYQGSNAQYNYNTGQMYQGLSPAGMGNLKSISLHPSMVGDLSGATINYIRVYFGFNHWYYNAGGTARIGLHGHASIPGSFSGSGIAATSYGWPRPGARWVDLPSSVFAGFKSGAYKGIYLEGDGTYGTYGIADRPTIEIGFTK